MTQTQTQTTKVEPSRTDHPSKDPIADIRVAAQELHGAISDAAAKSGQAIKDHLQSIGPTVRSLVTSVKAELGTQTDVAKHHLAEAVRNLESAEAQIATSVKATGEALQTATRQALADSRNAVQKISEVVATTRSAQATPKSKA